MKVWFWDRQKEDEVLLFMIQMINHNVFISTINIQHNLYLNQSQDLQILFILTTLRYISIYNLTLLPRKILFRAISPKIQH